MILLFKGDFMGTNLRGRFRERKYSYIKKRRLEKENIEKKTKRRKKEDESIFKIIIFSPLILFGFIKNIIDYFTQKPTQNNKKINLNNVIIKNTINIEESKVNIIVSKRKKELLKKNIIMPSLQLNSQIKKKNNYIFDNNYNKTSTISDTLLEASILLKLKKKLNKLTNECDIIESEAYLINKYSNDKNLLEKAIKIRKEIEILEEKIDKINKEFNIIKKDLLQNPKEIQDEDLLNDILKYKEIVKSIEQSKLPHKIKLLEEYQLLMNKIENLENKTEKLEKEKEDREKELSTRDNRYKEAKEKMANLDEINKECNNIINKNKKYIEELNSKVGIINTKKYTKYKLQGLNNLLTTSLKYVGLLSLTPLRGLLPGIAAKTFATRKLVSNMYHSIHYEKQEKIIYTFENHYSEINSKICDINIIETDISSALREIAILKSEFKDKFLKYNLKEYDEAYRKIELLEEDVFSSSQKIKIMKTKLITNQKQNKETLKKVRKLNENNK